MRLSDHLIDTIVGGVLAVGGGFLGALVIRWRDSVAADRRENREFRAAMIVVLDEVAANIATLEVTLKDHTSIPELHDNVYHERQLALAQRLKPDVREALADAYIYAQAPSVLRETRATQMGPPPPWVPAMQQVDACHTKFLTAKEELERYAAEHPLAK